MFSKTKGNNMIFENIFRVAFSSTYTTLYAFICSIIFCLIFQIFFLRKEAKKKGIKLSFFHYFGVYIFLFYVLVVFRITGVGTLWDIGHHNTIIRVSEIHLIPFSNLYFDLPFILLNIIMTIPLGFLLPLIWPEFRSLKKVAFTGFCFSLLIELSQLLNKRNSTVDDLIMNTLGAILGCLLFMIFFALVKSKKQFKITFRANSPLIKHEAYIYLLCSFAGLFLLFNPHGASDLAYIIDESYFSVQVRKVILDGLSGVRNLVNTIL